MTRSEVRVPHRPPNIMASLYISHSIEQAKEVGHKPRIHPNGFVQLDLAPGERLHIWPDQPLPRPRIEVPIHDHSFSFDSHVLVGAIRNSIYQARPETEGLHRIFEIFPFMAVGIHNPFTLKDRRRHHMEVVSTNTTRAGEDYSFPAFELHETYVEGFTATVITVTAIDKLRHARVAVPFPEIPDSDFRRDSAPEEELWDIIAKLEAHSTD